MSESQPDHKALLDAAYRREGEALAEVVRLQREVADLQARLAQGPDTQIAAYKALLGLVLRAKVRPCSYGVEPEGGWPAWVDACWELGAREVAP